MRSKVISAFTGLAAATAMVMACQSAGAATASGAGLGQRATSAFVRALLAADGGNVARPSAKTIRAIASYKARHDTQAAQIRAAAAASMLHNARKRAAFRNGTAFRRGAAAYRAVSRSVTSGSGYAWVDSMNQQGQQTGYWCGPATVSEIAITVPGPSYVTQATAASYMGTTSSNGTDVSAMVNGMNHYVGVPDFGWNFYGYVAMNDNPTAAQRSAFLSDLQADVGANSPVAGDAWEVPGGPHLVGHPANQQIFHYFEIGGWSTNTSQVYYADSATSVWSSVPAYSWYDTYTLETILGGRGYIW